MLGLLLLLLASVAAAGAVCSAGSYAVGDSCFTCPPGYYCTNDNLAPCPFRTYSSMGQSACTRATSSQIADSFGALACPRMGFKVNTTKNTCDLLPGGKTWLNGVGTDCSAGTFALPGASTCTACNGFPGYTCYSTSSSLLVPCPPGTVWRTNNGTCAICGAGHYCPTGTEELPCPTGFYAPSQGMASCIPCPRGLVSSGSACVPPGNGETGVFGSAVELSHNAETRAPGYVEPCGEGMVRSGTGNACVVCEQGKACSPLSGDVNPCLAKQVSFAGSYFCTKYPLGHTYDTAKAGLVPCHAKGVGYYYDVGTRECVACTPGNFCPDGLRMLPCPPGFKSGSKASHCTACGGNEFCDDGSSKAGESERVYPYTHPEGINCPPGQYAQGSKCLECPVGSYCPGTGEQLPCPSGYVCKEGTRFVFDGNCEEGYYGNGNVCAKCTAGHYCPPGVSTPLPCPTGFYCPEKTARWYAHPCPAGKYYGDITGLSDENCTGGEDCTEGHFCPPASIVETPCPPGTYNGQKGGTSIESCTPCPAGFVCGSPGMGQSTEQCPKGHYCPEGTAYAKERPCPEGTYNGEEGATSIESCVPCPAGKLCPRGSTGEDVAPCPYGHYCPEVEGSPTLPHPCESGTYCPKLGAESASDCEACPEGKYCLEGAGSPTGLCPPGHTCGAGTGNPYVAPCPEHSYQDESGATSCKACPPGHYCPAGSVAPVVCEDGTYSLGSSECKECPEGFFCPRGTAYPFLCLPGTYSAPGQAQCLPCPAGHYCVRTEASFGGENARGAFGIPESGLSGARCQAGTHCPPGMDHAPVLGTDECPQGSFCPNTEAQPLPVPCPRGTYGGAPGLDAETKCTACPAGSFCEEGAIKPSGVCAQGYYCPQGSHTAQQTPCPAGRFGKAPELKAESECEECPAGSFCPLASVFPSQCPQGYYCPQGSAAPSPCPQGSYLGDAGEADASACLPCPAGMYCGTVGLQGPSGPCDPGYFCTGGAFSPTPKDGEGGRPCSPGHFCMQGALREEPCSPGYYNPYSGGASPDSCLPCPAGRFCGEGVADPEPNKCEPGFYCTGMATTARQHMTPPGHWSGEGAQKPELCAPGTRQPYPAQSSCIPCGSQDAPDGLNGGYCPNHAMVDPLPCPAGSSCEEGDGVSFELCGKGTYSPASSYGGDSCLPCPPGRVCVSDGLERPGFERVPGEPGEVHLLSVCEPGFFCRSGVSSRNPVGDGVGSGAPCPPGNYCPAGTFEPLPCPVGTYNPDTGAESVLACLACPAGKVCSRPGLRAPDMLCAKGYYCTGGAYMTHPTDRETGDICAPGYYSGEGAGAPIRCPEGTYSDTFGEEEECKHCPMGFYCPPSEGLYQTKLPCSPGHYCPMGVSTQFECPVGTFSRRYRNTEKDACTPCPGGMYCPIDVSDCHLR